MTAATETTEQTPSQTQAVSVAKEARLIVHDSGSFANLLDTSRFEHMWRVATVFSKSGMVPKHFQMKPEACFVAVQMAVRLEVDPFMFMQNTYLSPDGKPAMEGKLAIALINARGPFNGGVNFEYSGEGDDYGCTAFGIHKADGKRRELRVDIGIAKSEGWYGRNKKWQSMQDQMLLYRAGAWFGRAYCPEVLMGMQTAEELMDLGNLRSGPDGTYVPSTTPPRPTRASVSAPTETADAEAEAANRALDREAERIINGTVETEEAEEAASTDAETISPEPRQIDVPMTPNGRTKDWRGYVNLCKQDVEAAPSAVFIDNWRGKQGKTLDSLRLSFPDGAKELDEAIAFRLTELPQANG